MLKRKNSTPSSIVIIIFALVLVLFLAACSKEPANSSKENEPVESSTQSAAPSETEHSNGVRHEGQMSEQTQLGQQEQSGEQTQLGQQTQPDQQQSDQDSMTTPQAPQRVPLSYTAVEFPAVTAHTIQLADVIEQKKLDHNLLVYMLSADDEELQLGIVNEQTVQPFGEPFPQHYLTELTVSEVKLFNRQMIVVQAMCGANCAVNYLLQLNSNTSIPGLYFELYGGLQFADIDDDKELEMLAHVGGALSEIEVYRLMDERLMQVNLNKALQADKGVAYNSEQHTFAIYAAEQQLIYRYSPTEHSLQLLSTH